VRQSFIGGAALVSLVSSTIGRFSPPAGLGGRLILRCCSSALLPFLDVIEAALLEVRGEVGATDREPQAAVANPSRTPPS
jgi:hypothetical protein